VLLLLLQVAQAVGPVRLDVRRQLEQLRHQQHPLLHLK